MNRERIKVLLVEDNQGDARLIQEMLSEAGAAEFEIVHAEKLMEGLQRLIKERFDVVLLDLSLPDSQGLATFDKVHYQTPGVPILMLTGLDDEALAVKAVQKGAQDYLVKGKVDSNMLVRAIRYAIERHKTRVKEEVVKAREVGVGLGRIMAVFSLQGGCGTTTLAINLAGYLAQNAEKQCIICDLDFYKGDASYSLDLDTNFTIVDFLQNLSRIDEALLRSSLAQHESGLFTLAPPSYFEEVEDITGEQISQVLQTLRHHFDFIVVDCLKAINNDFPAIMDAADTILLLTLQTVLALKNTKRCLELFEQLGYDQNKVKVVLNRFKKGVKPFSVKNIENILDWPITSTVPDLELEAAQALNTGNLLQNTRSKSKLTKEIVKLGSILTGAEPKAPSRSGLFGFLKRGG